MVPSDPPPVANNIGSSPTVPDAGDEDEDDVQQHIPVTPPLCAPFTTVVGPRVFSSSTRTWQERETGIAFVVRRVSVFAGGVEDLGQSGRSGCSV